MEKGKIDSEEHQRETVVKTTRTTIEQCQIGIMPMDILHRIISQLPIKEAVRTSILSRQWKYVWCHHANLVFYFRSMMPKHYDQRFSTSHGDKQNKIEFIERIDAVLQRHSGTAVEKFEVRFRLENEHADWIERWLNFAIASKTRQLIFDFSSVRLVRAPCNFDFRLFDGSNSSHLQSIELHTVSLKIPVEFKGFVNLKRLHLVNTNIIDEGLQLILSNCNVLEFLGIVNCGMLTSLRISHPLNSLKHLQIEKCNLLQVIELNFSLLTLEYSGRLIPLAHPGTSLLTNICMKLSDICGALEYVFTKLPSTLPRLEMLTLKCSEMEVWDTKPFIDFSLFTSLFDFSCDDLPFVVFSLFEVQRATWPGTSPKFVYLKHLRLELKFFGTYKRKTDVLDFACLLEAAPFLERLDFHMWMFCDHKRYNKGDGELRSLPPHPHCYLKMVNITGFYGQKDQLELVLHILRNSVMLEAMKIDPKPIVAAEYRSLSRKDSFAFLDGYEVVLEFLRKEDHFNVVDVTEVLRSVVESTPVLHMIDPFWIKFLSENRGMAAQPS